MVYVSVSVHIDSGSGDGVSGGVSGNMSGGGISGGVSGNMSGGGVRWWYQW